MDVIRPPLLEVMRRWKMSLIEAGFGPTIDLNAQPFKRFIEDEMKLWDLAERVYEDLIPRR